MATSKKTTSKKSTKDPDSLTATERREFRVALENRADLMQETIATELATDEASAIENIRVERNIMYTANQLNDMVAAVGDQIEAVVGEHLEDESTAIKLKIVEIDDEYSRKENELRTRHRQEHDELMEKKRQAKDDLQDQLRNAKARIAKEHADELTKKKQQLVLDLAKAEETEIEIKREAKQRAITGARYRGRIEAVIHDKLNSLREKLLITSSREEAIGLLTELPSVNYIIEMCKSVDGISNMLQSLNPDVKSLPAPSVPDDGKSRQDSDDIIDAEVVSVQ